MANVSPYLKNLSTKASSKLISLFNSMSSPSFLLAKESNPALLHILLETINNLIEHQHSQNPILLYAIIRNNNKFQSLQHFDLHKSLLELEERKLSKNEQPQSRQPLDPMTKPGVEITSPTTPVTPFSVGDDDEEDDEDDDEEEPEDVSEIRPLSEKARGKLPEGVEIPRRESTLGVSGTLAPSTDRKEFHPTDAWVRSQEIITNI
jgi:hypothetical protein